MNRADLGDAPRASPHSLTKFLSFRCSTSDYKSEIDENEEKERRVQGVLGKLETEARAGRFFVTKQSLSSLMEGLKPSDFRHCYCGE